MAIASTLNAVKADAAGFTRAAASEFPDSLAIELRKVRDLRYGENPHQRAALYTGFGTHPGYSILQGKELSYTNLLDLDAAIRMVIEFTEPAAALIKHTNPCGAATGSSAADAYVRAREADSLSAFGAAVALNRPIDVEAARAIVVDAHRCGDRSSRRGRGARDSGRENRHASGHTGARAGRWRRTSSVGQTSRFDPLSAVCSCKAATS